MPKLHELAGWYGAAAIVLAYGLVSFKLLGSDTLTYQLLNLTGSAGIIWVSLVKGVRQSVVLNVFWAAIAAFAIIRLLVAG